MNNKLYHTDLANYTEGDFKINSRLEVFFGKKQIGKVRIVENLHPEGDDEILCFLPGNVGFKHYPVYDAGIACETIYEKYYSQNSK